METNNEQHNFASTIRQNPDGFKELEAFARGLALANAQSADFVGCAAHGLRQQIWDRDDALFNLREENQRIRDSMNPDTCDMVGVVAEKMGIEGWRTIPFKDVMREIMLRLTIRTEGGEIRYDETNCLVENRKTSEPIPFCKREDKA